MMTRFQDQLSRLTADRDKFGRALVWWEEGRWWVVAWTEMGVRFRVYCLSAADAADWARGVLGVRS